MPVSKHQIDKSRPKQTFWQPPEERNVVSDEGRKWLEDNAEAIKGWSDWAETNELPLDKYRSF